MELNLTQLEQFIVAAKTATYVGNGRKLLPYRAGSQDLQFAEGDWAYHDSYFGNADFIGQEVVYFRRQPVWAMNYYGRILRPDLITADEAGQMIMRSLSAMYREGRFLGGFVHRSDDLVYTDTSDGAVTNFTGKERITRGAEVAYDLVYHGGLVKS